MDQSMELSVSELERVDAILAQQFSLNEFGTDPNQVVQDTSYGDIFDQVFNAPTEIDPKLLSMLTQESNFSLSSSDTILVSEQILQQQQQQQQVQQQDFQYGIPQDVQFNLPQVNFSAPIPSSFRPELQRYAQAPSNFVPFVEGRTDGEYESMFKQLDDWFNNKKAPASAKCVQAVFEASQQPVAGLKQQHIELRIISHPDTNVVKHVRKVVGAKAAKRQLQNATLPAKALGKRSRASEAPAPAPAEDPDDEEGEGNNKGNKGDTPSTVQWSLKLFDFNQQVVPITKVYPILLRIGTDSEALQPWANDKVGGFTPDRVHHPEGRGEASFEGCFTESSYPSFCQWVFVMLVKGVSDNVRGTFLLSCRSNPFTISKEPCKHGLRASLMYFFLTQPASDYPWSAIRPLIDKTLPGLPEAQMDNLKEILVTWKDNKKPLNGPTHALPSPAEPFVDSTSDISAADPSISNYKLSMFWKWFSLCVKYLRNDYLWTGRQRRIFGFCSAETAERLVQEAMMKGIDHPFVIRLGRFGGVVIVCYREQDQKIHQIAITFQEVQKNGPLSYIIQALNECQTFILQDLTYKPKQLTFKQLNDDLASCYTRPEEFFASEELATQANASDIKNAVMGFSGLLERIHPAQRSTCQYMIEDCLQGILTQINPTSEEDDESP